ncbi:hypothetical protein [Mycolicibacter longobardus]|uniref:Uncharacterized protein n=1 Tax=Mycolicibacter longobardus TaxID=1108812 RepID=A0A1X1YHF4_9MYCO|nr:hypothetical protein [Mycolicibacter longobardus]ORW10539.1 hypothetical protein AWC16_14350 [Mycolicibacter longobardus]
MADAEKKKVAIGKPALVGLLLAIGAGSALIALSVVTGLRPADDVDGRSFVNAEWVDEDDYLGLAEQEALDKAKRENKPVRVVERDGKHLPVTMDLIPGRLNFSVKDGAVYKVDIEG